MLQSVAGNVSNIVEVESEGAVATARRPASASLIVGRLRAVDPRLKGARIKLKALRAKEAESIAQVGAQEAGGINSLDFLNFLGAS